MQDGYNCFFNVFKKGPITAVSLLSESPIIHDVR